MPLYDYSAKTREGKLVSGVVVAESEALALDALRERSFFDASLVEREKPGVLSMSLDFLQRVSRKDIVVFSRQLSVMSSAGVPLVKAMRTLGAQMENKRFSDVLREVTDNIEGGSRLSDAMSAHPSVFTHFTVNMIRSGETTGRVAEVLTYLADQEEKDYDLASKIKGAMMYPAFIISGMVIVGFIMMTFVLPKLTGILEESGAELPITTKILIATSDFFVAYWYAIIIGAVGGAVGLRFAIRTEQGRRIWDTMKLHVPIFGGMFRRIYLVRFARSLETLMTGGVDTVSALAATSEIVSNVAYKQLILETKKEVEDGNSIVTVFSGNKLVPTMFTQMLSVGEETGKLREILGRLSNFYARELDTLVSSLVTLIEPIIMVLMGVAVAVMVSAVIMPMFNLANSV